MNQQQSAETEFARRLRSELTAIVAERGAAQAPREATSAAVAVPGWRRHGPRLALGGAGALAAIVAAILLLASGPTAQPASAAEILHEAATAASASDAPATLIPGPGQYLYRKEQRLNIVGWLYPLPAKEGNRGLMMTGGTMKGPGAFNALLPTTVEWWTDSDAGGRHREVAGTPRFWSKEEEVRWKAAGSPLPSPFNAEYQQRYQAAFRDALELGPGVVDTESKGFGNFTFPETSKLSTEPEALRHAVEANTIEVSGFNLMYPKAERLDPEQTMEELINLLFEGTPSPRLQAAIFNALAELPGVAIETEATDGLGRHGNAIQLHVTEGVRGEYLFDPTSGEVLASRGVLVDPAANSNFKELPAGTTISETDYLETGVVDSTHETAAEAEGTGLAATTNPSHRK
jgi:hypothetical protein